MVYHKHCKQLERTRCMHCHSATLLEPIWTQTPQTCQRFTSVASRTPLALFAGSTSSVHHMSNRGQGGSFFLTIISSTCWRHICMYSSTFCDQKCLSDTVVGDQLWRRLFECLSGKDAHVTVWSTAIPHFVWLHKQQGILQQMRMSSWTKQDCLVGTDCCREHAWYHAFVHGASVRYSGVTACDTYMRWEGNSMASMLQLVPDRVDIPA